jgi:hypothetical protein
VGYIMWSESAEWVVVNKMEEKAVSFLGGGFCSLTNVKDRYKNPFFVLEIV